MNRSNTSFKLSIVVPTFNEDGNIEPLYRSLLIQMEKLHVPNFEIIYVNDGSSDGSLEVIKRLTSEDERVKFVSFSKNFGHQYALKAGLDFATGDAVISMDADLQHPPELIGELLAKWDEGYQVVYTIRKNEKGISWLKRATSKLFYYLINKISEYKVIEGAADFRLMDRKVVQELKKINDQELFFRGIIPSLGFRQIPVYFEPNQRFSGSTKYSMKKMIKLAITGIVSTSVKPLYFSIYIGAIMAFLAFMYGIYAIYIAVFTDKAIAGWTSTLVSVVFIGGVQLMVMGIIGLYIGKVFINSKGRPNYIVDETNI